MSEEGGGKRGGEGGGADILQLFFILTTGEAKYQVKKRKCDKYKSETNEYGSSGNSDRSDTDKFSD